MRVFKILLAGLLLAVSSVAIAEIDGMPAGTTWYLHVDFEEMRNDGPGKGIYDFVADEVFADLKEDTGVDVAKELDTLTGYSMRGQGPVIVLDGSISQMSKDRLMAVIAATGDLAPKQSSGQDYFRLKNGESDRARIGGDNIEIQFDELGNESWISLALPNKVLVTSSEEQMQAMLAQGGQITGSRGNGNTLIVLTAEKPLLQAGMDSAVLGEGSDGDSAWESNLLSNTEQVAFLLASARDKLAVEARLTTTEPAMAESLASVARGLVSLASFSDDMDAATSTLLAGVKIDTEGRNLVMSLAVDPELVVKSLRD